MRIGILEWICGGGLQNWELDAIDESLLTEGWAILNAVAQDFEDCGHEVLSSIDSRLVSRLYSPDRMSKFQFARNTGFTDELPSTWWDIAAKADAIVVIAPEFSNILQAAVAKLEPVCKLLLNCRGDFLAATCDKWLTAQRLAAAGINHPATQRVRDASESWLEQHRAESHLWILKPADGAGCEAIQLVRDEHISSVLESLRSSHAGLLIQPFHTGIAYSRSAIVDSVGKPCWLPLVTQEFRVTDSMEYRGGQVLRMSENDYEDTSTNKRYSIEALDEVLDATLRSFGAGVRGWVGVDLIYSDALNDWMVIEVNPRMTTSFTGLRVSYGPGLMEQMLRAGQDIECSVGGLWKPIAFNSSGKRVH